MPFSRLTRSLAFAGAGVLALLFMGACGGSPEQKKRAYVDSGDRYQAEGKHREASLEYRNALQIDPRYAEAHTKLAEAYSRLGQLNEALAAYVRAADSNPEDAELQLVAGSALLVARRFEDARARAVRATELAPGDPRGHILLGNALAGSNTPDEAIKSIEEAIRLDPNASLGYAALGRIEAVRGRATEAEAAFRKAVELSPDAADGHMALAQFLLSAGRLEDGEASLRRAAALAPHDTLVNRAMAALLISTDRATEAEPHLLEASAADERFRFVLADYYAWQKRYEEAFAHLEKLAQQERPTASDAIRRMARLHAELGNHARAEALVDDLMRREPSHPENLLLKGSLQLVAGKKSEASDNIKAAADADPNSAPIQFALGQALLALGDADAAERAFAQVLALNPRATAAEVALSRLKLLKGQTQASLQLATGAAAREPENVSAQLAVIRSLAAAGEVRKAMTTLEALEKTQTDDAGVHTLKGVLAATAKDSRTARHAFERALTLDPDSIEALSGLVTLDFAENKPGDAQLRVSRRLQASKPRGDLLVLAAHVAIRTGDAPEAEAYLRQAIEVDPASLQAYATLGQLYLSQKKIDAARAEFAALSRRQSRPIAALTMIGTIDLVQGKTSSAREQFERVLAIDPRAVIAANNLAWIYAEEGENLEQALALARTAATAVPRSPEVQDTLGWVHYKRGEAEQAVSALRKSTEADPRNPIYQYHLGLAQLQNGDSVAARLSLEKALELGVTFPGADDARRTLTELTQRQ